MIVRNISRWDSQNSYTLLFVGRNMKAYETTFSQNFKYKQRTSQVSQGWSSYILKNNMHGLKKAHQKSIIQGTGCKLLFPIKIARGQVMAQFTRYLRWSSYIIRKSPPSFLKAPTPLPNIPKLFSFTSF